MSKSACLEQLQMFVPGEASNVKILRAVFKSPRITHKVEDGVLLRHIGRYFCTFSLQATNIM